MKSLKLKFPVAFFSALLIVAAMGFSQKANAQSVKPVTIQSSKNYEGTIDAIKKAVSGGGMMVLTELDQGKILSMTGLQVNGHSFFIGNPNVGKEAFSADPSVGLVLPVRVNVYEENGKTFINYYNPSDLLVYSNSKKANMIGEKLDGKLSEMMKMLSR